MLRVGYSGSYGVVGQWRVGGVSVFLMGTDQRFEVSSLVERIGGVVWGD
jgi:hypothetical protein